MPTGCKGAGAIERAIDDGESHFTINIGSWSCTVDEADCRELSFGRVPALVQEAAKRLVDWTHEDLRKNAAKPVRLATKKGRSR